MLSLLGVILKRVKGKYEPKLEIYAKTFYVLGMLTLLIFTL